MTVAAPPPRERVFGRESLVLGAFVVLLLGVMLAVGAAANGSGYLINSDARFSYLVATDPFGDGRAFAGQPFDVAVAYRYGRILYSFLAWALAGGRPGLIVWTMPIVYALSIGLMVAAACDLCAARGLPAVRGLWVLLVPAMWVTIPIVFPDPLFVALILVVYRLAIAGRTRSARIAAAFMLLAREAAALALVPLIAADVRRRAWRSVAIWGISFVPLVVWWAWVRVRIGSWPPLDPGYSGALSWPFGGVVQVVREGRAVRGWFLLALVMGALTVAAGVWAWTRRPFSLASQGALLFSLLVVFLGPSALRLPAQAVRLMLPAQALASLAIVAWPSLPMDVDPLKIVPALAE